MTVQLTPKSNIKGPICSDYKDINKVVAFEKAARAYRAKTEHFQISHITQSVFGTYEVISGISSGLYFVDIFNNKKNHDTCTCKDFSQNLLGTCKHLEAVYLALNELKLLVAYKNTQPIADYITIIDGKNVLIGKHQSVKIQNGEIVKYDEKTLRASSASASLLEKTKERNANLARKAKIERLIAGDKIKIDVLTKPLFPYQQDAVKYMTASGRSLLALRMGGGKTASVLAVCEILKTTDKIFRVLLVVPASLKQQWANEIKIFVGSKSEIVHKAEELKPFSSKPTKDIQYKIVNYELLLRNPDLAYNINTDIVILDEAQKIKNFRSKTGEIIRRIPNKFFFALTGTPIENRLDDLYSIMQLIDEDVFGPLWKFNFDFHSQTETGRIDGCKHLDLLRERIKPVVFSKNRAEILSQLPPLTEETIYVPMSEAQSEREEFYRKEAAKLFAKASGKGLTRGEQQILAGYLLKARQACNSLMLCEPDNPDATSDSPKLDELQTIVSDVCITEGKKLVVFSEWIEQLNIIAAMLKNIGIDYVMLHGGIPTKKRPDIIESFKTQNHKMVFLSTDAGGIGLNLQFASYVVHFDLPWNPAKLDQRTARTHRIGQKNNVYVYYLCAEEGIERGIKDVLVSKREVRTATLEADSKIQEVELQSFVDYLKDNTDMFAIPAIEPTKAAIEPEEVKVTPKVRQIIQKMKKFKVHLDENKSKEAIQEAFDIILMLISFLQSMDASDYDSVIKLITRKLMSSNNVYVNAHGVLVSLRHFMQQKNAASVGQIYLRTTLLRARSTIDSLLGLLK